MLYTFHDSLNYMKNMNMTIQLELGVTNTCNLKYPFYSMKYMSTEQ